MLHSAMLRIGIHFFTLVACLKRFFISQVHMATKSIKHSIHDRTTLPFSDYQ